MQQRAPNSLAKGALITVMMRWLDRVVGIVSTLILARLLVPDDFGIVAMASVVVAFVDVIFDLGVSVALIQKKSPEQKYYDCAWTMRIVQSAAVAVLLTCGAPFAAEYYHDPRVTAAIQVMAFSLFILSLENIGIVTFQKELNFLADFKFVFTKRLIGFATTILLTLWLHSYWGMLLGVLCSRSCGVILSYMVHPMRPRFSLHQFGEIFSISQWVLVKNVSQYLDRNLHIILVGGGASTAVTGGYTLANEVSDMPGTELLAPINRVLFPAFAQVKDNLAELTRLVLLAQGIQVLITVPACVGFAMTATEVVPLMLGVKWLFIVPFIQILALSNILQSINSSANYALTVMGRIRLVAVTSWVQIALFALGALLLRHILTAQIIAQLRFAAIFLTFGLSYFILIRNMPTISLRLLLKTTYRPALACVVMALGLYLVGTLQGVPLPAMLAMKVATGVLLYSGAVFGLWLLAKRPDGAERYLLDKVRPPRAVAAGVMARPK